MFYWIKARQRLKRVMTTKKGDEKEVALRQLAEELGCSVASTYEMSGKHHEEEVIRRIQEMINLDKEASFFPFVVIAAIGAILSALAAWFVILRR